MHFLQNQKIVLPEPDATLKKRLTEVKFYSMFEQLFLKADQKPEIADALFEVYAYLSGVNPEHIRNMFSVFSRKADRPTTYEMVIMARYEGLSYAKISRILHTTDQSVSRYLKRFAENNYTLPKPLTNKYEFNDMQEIFDIMKDTWGPLAERVVAFKRKYTLD